MFFYSDDFFCVIIDDLDFHMFGFGNEFFKEYVVVVEVCFCKMLGVVLSFL